jgi:hypothetical protein
VGGLLALTAAQTGCYIYAAPTTAAPTAGSRLAFTLTDRGRAALANQLGPGVLRLEGALIENSGDSYVISVESVRNIDRGSSKWSGERVTLQRDDVASVFERKFSKRRTIITVASVTAGITAFILSRNLLGLGDLLGDRGEPPGGPGT